MNRELSWIGFNYRILSEARDKANPLFERLKFLSITSSNLDEFFMVRVASLKDMINADCDKKDIAGMTPKEQIEAILNETHDFVNLQYSTYNRSLVPALKGENLIIIDKHEHLNEEQKKYVDRYFDEDIYPVLTPMAVDSSRPFPLIRNKSLNIAALLEEKESLAEKVEARKQEKNGKKKEEKQEKELEFATVQVPSVLPRIIRIPSEEEGQTTIILLEEIIERHIQKLFMNYKVVCAHPYRVMRNADLSIDEDDAEDLLKEIEKQLKKRQWGEAIRLEIEDKMDDRLLNILKEELNIRQKDIFQINGPLDLTFLMRLYGIEGFDHLKTPKYIPQPNPAINLDENIFDQISKGDILLHHPYQTFDPVVDFVRQAATDKKVLAIKQTLYRVSGNSPIIASLAQAAENGKQVSVLVELKARFDEENNIEWSRRLERAGCHVIYGLDGFKVHSKLCQITRKAGDEVQYITQIGTGNYNEKTACLYTDLSLMTADTEIAKEARRVFQALAMGEIVEHTDKLLVAPLCLQNKVLAMIDDEIAAALAGKDAYIGLKMNALTDKKIIDRLIEASCAGVKIDLIIRGICCLIPGVKDATENIRVISIVGRFLEHSRIYIFGSKGREKVYIASADYMTRNTLRRVEVAAPVCDPAIKERLLEMFRIMLNDNQKARHEDSEGNYRIPMTIERPVDAQETFYQQAYEAAASKNV